MKNWVLFLSLGAIVLLVSCHKHNDSPSFRLSTETAVYSTGNDVVWQYLYASGRKLQEIVLMDTNKEVRSRVEITDSASTYLTPGFPDYQGVLKGGSWQQPTAILQIGVTFTFSYDGNKRLTGIKGENGSQTDISYDGNGNATKISQSYIGLLYYEYKLGDYDNQPTAYSVGPQDLFFLNGNFSSFGDINFMNGLSRNNPRDIRVRTYNAQTKNYDSSEYLLVYTYDENHYPTTRTVTKADFVNPNYPPDVTIYLKNSYVYERQ